MIEETRIHVAVVAVFAIITAIVLVFWLTPRLIVYGFFLMVVVLAYGGLYLVIASWLDPQRGEVNPGDSPTTQSIEPSDDGDEPNGHPRSSS